MRIYETVYNVTGNLTRVVKEVLSGPYHMHIVFFCFTTCGRDMWYVVSLDGTFFYVKVYFDILELSELHKQSDINQ